ncbi:protein FD-like [Neltuma alba]|uniref:protein FD-like n=1 Tax=Neltuma alba TaxID=207710 RepID=UPI0010A4F89B|nr:protein FD-like [Prosopis alba]
MAGDGSSTVTKTMDEVWSDIKLFSLCHYPISHTSLLHHFFSPPSSSAFHSSSSRIPSNKRTRHQIHGSSDPRHQHPQAYTNELERELASLREENARLRRQQEKSGVEFGLCI